MKEKTNKIIMILLCILLASSSILINSTNPYYIYVQILGAAIAIVYFIIRLIQKNPIKIIKNKLDIFVILLVTSTFIPLITNTYVSLNGTVQVLLQYIYALNIYILFREITYAEKKYNKIFSNVLIILTVILILIGIDGITTNAFSKILELIGINPEPINGENRLVSIFEYPNTLAAYIASVLFLNINETLKQNKKVIKIIYKSITLLFIIAIILTYSKGMFLILPILLIGYILSLKEKRREVVIDIIIATIIAIIYGVVFEKICNLEGYIFTWFFLLLAIAIYIVINLLIQRINFEKISLKKIAISLVAVLIVFITYISIALNIYDEFVALPENVSIDYNAKVIDNISPNTVYTFEFDVQAQSPKDLEDTFTINLLERDNRNFEIKNTEIKLGTYTGIKQIEVLTSENTAEIKIEFESKYKYASKELIIKSLKINGSEVPLQYKYLPTKLVEKVKNIRLGYKTSRERFEMIENGLEISKQNLFTGIGGNGWQYKYKDVQSYDYTSNKLHSYPTKVLLEFGLFGLVSYLGIIILIVKLLIDALKNKEVHKLSWIFAILTIGVHTIIDLDMEYMHILVYTFAILGILANELKQKEGNSNIQKVGNIVFIVLILVSTYLSKNDSIYNKYSEVVESKKSRNGLNTASVEYRNINYNTAQKYEKLLKYERYGILNTYAEIIKYYIDSSYENKIEIVEKYYNKIDSYEIKNINDIINKIYSIDEIINNLEKQNNSGYYNITEKFMNIIINEYEKNIEEIKVQVENKYIQQDAVMIIQRLERIYRDSVNKKEDFILGVKFIKDSGIELNKEEIVNTNIELKSKDVLIYHTHATESYESKEPYEQYKFHRTEDKNHNVTKVGTFLKDLLQEEGFKVTHDTKYYDLPSVDRAYWRSEVTVKNTLAKNKDLGIIIDLHRDAYTEIEHIASTVEINGEKAANLRFVIGIEPENKYWMQNLRFAIEIQKIANRQYPGLFKTMLLRDSSYNQEFSEYSMLIEVGEDYNSMEEALNSMKYFSKVLAQM